MRMSRARWVYLSEEKQTELLAEQLWLPGKLEAYTKKLMGGASAARVGKAKKSK
jgi:hypothetical protein